MENKKDFVATTHPEYFLLKHKRDIYSDVCAGTLRLREKHKQYLPKFPAETEEDYRFRIETSTLFNLTQKTRNMMTGLVFKDSITLEDDVNDELRDLWENIDNAGTHGDVFCRKVFESSFEGYSAILIDAPMVTATSREEQMRLGLRPYWVHYKAEDIWNWQYQVNQSNKKKELSLIVFREAVLEAKGAYTSDLVVRFRVFRLVNGLVTWEVYREERSQDGRQVEYIVEAEGVLPQLTQIPVAIVSDLGADPFLLDIAIKNIEHFQTYSDYKSLIHKTCVPIPVGKGVEMVGSDKIVVGASTMIVTSSEGGFGFAEVSGSSLEIVRQSLQDNGDDIAMMGLSLLADKTARVDITATEALLNNVAETSELRMFARQLQDAIELALGITAEYLGLAKSDGGSVILGTQWQASDNKIKVQMDDFAQRTDIANKLTGLLPQEWIIRFLTAATEEEIVEMRQQMASEIPIIIEGEQLNAPPPPLDIEDEDNDDQDDLRND